MVELTKKRIEGKGKETAPKKLILGGFSADNLDTDFSGTSPHSL